MTNETLEVLLNNYRYSFKPFYHLGLAYLIKHFDELQDQIPDKYKSILKYIIELIDKQPEAKEYFDKLFKALDVYEQDKVISSFNYQAFEPIFNKKFSSLSQMRNKLFKNSKEIEKVLQIVKIETKAKGRNPIGYKIDLLTFGLALLMLTERFPLHELIPGLNQSKQQLKTIKTSTKKPNDNFFYKGEVIPFTETMTNEQKLSTFEEALNVILLHLNPYIVRLRIYKNPTIETEEQILKDIYKGIFPIILNFSEPEMNDKAEQIIKKLATERGFQIV